MSVLSVRGRMHRRVVLSLPLLATGLPFNLEASSLGRVLGFGPLDLLPDLGTGRTLVCFARRACIALVDGTAEFVLDIVVPVCWAIRQWC